MGTRKNWFWVLVVSTTVTALGGFGPCGEEPDPDGAAPPEGTSPAVTPPETQPPGSLPPETTTPEPAPPGATPPEVTAPAASECNAGEGGPFLKEGPYGSKPGIRGTGPYTYVPATLDQDSCKHPVIAFAMGTAAPSTVYTGYYTFLASWGFVVVVDPTLNGQISGDSLEKALDWVYQSEYAPRLSPRAGTIGHSQGGGGAYQAGRLARVQAIVGLEPGHGMGLVTWPKNPKPYLGLAGTLDQYHVQEALTLYGLSSGPRFFANLEGADHVSAPLNTAPGSLGATFRAAATAWFRCHLSSDPRACALFHPATCANLPGQWADCKGDNLP